MDKKQIQLENLLRKIALSTTVTGFKKIDGKNQDVFNAEAYCEQFSEIYGTGTFRHRYAQIANILYEFDIESLDMLIEKMSDILVEIGLMSTREPDSEIWKNTYGAVLKLKDHIELENVHIIRFKSEKLEKNIVNAMESIEEIKNDFSMVENNLQKAKKDIDGFNAQSVTVLGIFAGIVMAFTGAFSLLGGAFEKLDTGSLYRLFFLVLLLGFILINCIFILLYVIGKLINKSIAGNCKYSIPSHTTFSSLNFRNICECPPEWRKKCNPLRKFTRRYPYVAILDYAMIGFMGLVALAWCLKK